jgi:hypothetical protein
MSLTLNIDKLKTEKVKHKAPMKHNNIIRRFSVSSDTLNIFSPTACNKQHCWQLLHFVLPVPGNMLTLIHAHM